MTYFISNGAPMRNSSVKGTSGNPMSFTDLELKRIEKALSIFLAKRRPLAYLRSKLDLSYSERRVRFAHRLAVMNLHQ